MVVRYGIDEKAGIDWGSRQQRPAQIQCALGGADRHRHRYIEISYLARHPIIQDSIDSRQPLSLFL
jgi:hypothetical protein